MFRAWDPLLNRIVAVKRLRSGFEARPDELARLAAEAEAIATLRHPGIVQIFDIGEYDQQPFFAMEYCGGGSLAARLAGQPLGAREAAQLVRQLAIGVAEAHAHQLERLLEATHHAPHERVGGAVLVVGVACDDPIV